MVLSDTTPENWQPQHFQTTSECFRDHDPSSSLKIDVVRANFAFLTIWTTSKLELTEYKFRVAL
jgi:hypothetical protein